MRQARNDAADHSCQRPQGREPADAQRRDNCGWQVGWSKDPNATTSWTGGLVSGEIVRDKLTRIRLVAATPAPGLAATAPVKPAVSVSPQQNRGYALQFFSFAAIALVIYVLALRKRWSENAASPQ